MRTLKRGSSGNDVMEIQSLLEKMGLNPGPIDGFIGLRTEEAIKQFQRKYGLTADGIIGSRTDKVLQGFLLGYENYTIKSGDTLSKIAQKYHINLAALVTANSGTDPLKLQIRQVIKVPFAFDVVDTNINYTYEIMERDIQGLKSRYPFIEVGTAGKSVLGKNLYTLKLGNGPAEVFYNATHHALEWITSPLLMKFTENFAKAYAEGRQMRGYNPRDIWRKNTIYIMPMVNPDGVDLVLQGLQRDNPFYDQLITWNKGRMNFGEVWEANIKGVDLNHNYDASWELSKQAEPSYGVYGPGPTRFSGPSPESEPESKAVANFTRNHNFRLVLAYHSQGEVIYWTYQDKTPPEAQRIGELFARLSGYSLAKTTGISSYAGYKDWFIDKYRRPGFTIEVGQGSNPVPISQFAKIYEDNEGILLAAPSQPL
ncbi:LysM peptidoglycan-binding domain-containing protein [Desulfosporosinus fructosivorans]|uniref:LysM peptidoglycan-binding domain-containing protein n=1 Tax=Desulfosporosinus fructosivorans TaxID=2018669 RepID=A0A4Z0R7E1_9FIRM|nr:M14 family metallopeptidase [Desulfosporosinus fructosivorans]TGE39091.1 LysM peptidoglycan-binding domain-containing protein [Desulfosporosinus fructosivorans]